MLVRNCLRGAVCFAVLVITCCFGFGFCDNVFGLAWFTVGLCGWIVCLLMVGRRYGFVGLWLCLFGFLFTWLEAGWVGGCDDG